ncbi:MAG TPA: hypothetical protein VKZ60_17495 [Chloroflexota bacterium]|jgi:hypothetical protein|nr:hypothetical protein [Chloroflexota bacterium]
MATTTEEVLAACPPHYWLITNEMTAEGTVERWRCQRCPASRERLLRRRRAPLVSKRYIGDADEGLPLPQLGYGGERVA